MIKNISTKIIANLLVLFCASGVTGLTYAESWELKKDTNGIQVYTKAVPGSPYKAVKAVTRVDHVPLRALVALLDDVEACSDWAKECVESTIHERVSPTEAYVYTHNDLPFPVKDRDALTHVTWMQNPSTGEVVMNSYATTGKLAPIKGRLRLTEATTSWRFKPLPSGAVEVTNESHINPGSPLPGWITNMLLINTPYNTLKSFVAEAAMPKYQQVDIAFIATAEEL